MTITSGLCFFWGIPSSSKWLQSHTSRRSAFQRADQDVRRIRKQSIGLFSRRSDALCETAGAAPFRSGLRTSGCRVPGSRCRPERLHRARHLCQRCQGKSPSGDGETLTPSQYVQQSTLAMNASIIRSNASGIPDLSNPRAPLLAGGPGCVAMPTRRGRNCFAKAWRPV